MPHLWLRAETRPNEARTALTPDGVRALREAGHDVTVEESVQRALPLADYRAAGAAIAPEGGWRGAPRDAWILGLKELPEEDAPLVHRHVMFGHAYKGQAAGARLLDRFRAGGGTLYDLEYLCDAGGRRVAAFGYWAGYAGAAVALMSWIAQADGGTCPPLSAHPDAATLEAELRAGLAGALPTVLVIGALGRTGTGATDFLQRMGLLPTRWDVAETRHGGPFPEVLAHHVFLNCILAQPGAPVFVPADAVTRPRRLTVIGDIACDPGSDFSPVQVYDAPTDWQHPARRVHGAPVLDVMAIDNLPSLLPRESTVDFAGQLLPHLLGLEADPDGIWTRARDTFHRFAAPAGR